MKYRVTGHASQQCLLGLPEAVDGDTPLPHRLLGYLRFSVFGEKVIERFTNHLLD